LDKPRHEPALTVMGPGTKWDGDLSFEGRVRVDGHFEGRMYTEDVLEVGMDGLIQGEVDVSRAIVSGKIEGAVRVREHLLIETTGIIEGKLDAVRVELRPGARLIGMVHITGGNE
jgi:cytoskeletal protein CcmA (bactofilin family)